MNHGNGEWNLDGLDNETACFHERRWTNYARL